jgi:hypothetical protein
MISRLHPTRSTHRRTGTSLVEVLVAIFVMGIGCLAILAMFPLGAMNMARSIKDDRCAQAAGNARAIAMAQSIAFDTQLINVVTTDWLFNNPTSKTNPPPFAFTTAPVTGPSYPVFVDPIGNLGYAGNPQVWVAGVAGPANLALLRRTTLSFANQPPNQLKWCTLLDDINFATNGTPAQPNGFVDRDGKYSWAWLLRKPEAGVPNLFEMTIVVFEQRSLSAAGLKTANEFLYQTTVVNANTIQLAWNAGYPVPQVREGGWILDVTPVYNGAGKGKTVTANSHAKFYRVVSVGEEGVNTVNLELATSVLNAGDLSAPNPPGWFVVFPNISEVFECGQVWKAWSI